MSRRRAMLPVMRKPSPPRGEPLRLLLRAGHPDGKAALIAALREHAGDVQRTAEAVDVPRATLYRLAREVLREHGAGKVGSGQASARKRAGKRREIEPKTADLRTKRTRP